ncbi:ATP-dependent exoDNAse (exonuclease V) beta subunit [Hymenobacter luteus]|uniref:DNA 3'-5' helicase n=3 Tax=Hymenobacter TaxID=89966 RepID=A0A7W9WDP3_9BACT|nr:UvrD-helicase domain-containing protein [Hymenobacter luteus]MBB4601700.1 ATP-dependent exoDNAse (exonuclease V) beta subunit [Hymenobacter latericoloratus]MBB6059872.1 ATP-dependent exoDNAse (exonuclease V) beta subunit [Hymenobacter luteus]
MPATFRIYSSSAGSGKTYQLTKEYLKLALGTDDASYFKRILAITFTNDAAGEMKQRIIGALRRFAQLPEGQTDPLLTDIAEELAAEGQLAYLPTPPERQQVLRERAARTFRLVLYHYADFAVSTIDSFVQRIVTAFTRELGLPATFEVELDSATVLQSAVALLLDRVNRDPNARLLSRTISDFALSKAEEGRSWNNLPEELVEFGQFLLSEPVHEAVEQLQKLSMQDYRRLHEALRQRKAEIEDAFRQVAQVAQEAVDTAGVTDSDLYQGRSGLLGYLTKWEERLQPEKEANSYVRATVEQDKWYSGKVKTAADKARVDAVKPALLSAYELVEKLRATLLPDYLLVTGMLPYLFQVSLLSELSKSVDQLSRDRGVVLIAEFNRRIAQIVLREPVPFLYERMGEKYLHLLIDEFQDTSVLQWNNLLPLVENAVAGGQLSLAVGDAKQAIYRWRGGEMEQILRLHQNQTQHLYNKAADEELRDLLALRYQTLDPSLEAASLNTNYRSAPAIIGFNNAFFTHVSATHEALPLVQGIYDAAFVQRGPESASAQAGGHVELLFTEDEAPACRYDAALGTYTPALLPGYLTGQTLDYTESTLYLTLQLVEKALADGFRLQDVAVLCRRRDQSRRVAKFLKERGYDIISADSLSLEFAEVVNLLVALFRVLNQPADTLARAEALLLVDRVVRHQAPTPERARKWSALANHESARPFFDELRALGYDVQEQETGNLGLYELTERLIGLFGLLRREAEQEYLFRFLDLTLEYSLRFGNNLNNFLTYWDQRKSSLSINAPAGRDAITITTVHKAKGLDYGVVIVPFADWSLKPYMGTLLWGRLADAAAKPLAQMPAVVVLPQTQALLHTPLAGQYTEEVEKTFLEGLNMLYVAFTRPRHRLYAISRKPRPVKAAKDVDAPTPPEPAKTVAELLHRYLLSTGHWHDEQMAYVLADAQGFVPAFKTQEAPTDNSLPLHNLTSTPWEERLRLKQHANTVFDFNDQQAQREWNRKLHYALRRVKRASEIDRVAAQLVAEGLVSTRERPELLRRLHEVTKHPRMAHYFSAQVEAEAEREILVGGTRKQDYKPDRIVFETTGRLVTLIDFKAPPPEPHHRQPLQRYAQLFRQLGYEQVRCVLYYFDTQEVVEF